MVNRILHSIDVLAKKSSEKLNKHYKAVILFSSGYYIALMLYMLFFSNGLETVFLFALYTLLFYNGVSGMFKAGSMKGVKTGDLPQKVFIAPFIVTLFAVIFYLTDNLDLMHDYLQLLETFIEGILMFAVTFLIYFMVFRNMALAITIYGGVLVYAIYEKGIVDTLVGLSILLGGIAVGAMVFYYVVRILKYSVKIGMDVSDHDANNALKLTFTRIGLIGSGVYVVMLFMLILVSYS